MLKRMNAPRQVKLFRNGSNQAIRIPREFELPGTTATLRKEGDRLVIEPQKKPSLLEVLKKLKPLNEKLPKVPRPPPEPVDL